MGAIFFPTWYRMKFMMDNYVPIFCLNAIISMFYFYTGTVYYMTEEEIIWFQCNGSFNTKNTALFNYSKYRF